MATHCAAAYVAFSQFPETIAFGVGLVYVAEGDVHEVVAVEEMTIEGLAVFEFDQLSVAWKVESQEKMGLLTMGLFCAAFNSDSGS